MDNVTLSRFKMLMKQRILGIRRKKLRELLSKSVYLLGYVLQQV